MKLASAASKGRCLVLGGRGFIGSHVVDRLLQEGWTVRMFGRRQSASDNDQPSTRWGERVELFEGEFGNQHDVELALSECDACVHAITTTLPHSSNQDIRHDVETNLISTLNLMRLIRDSTVGTIVFLSSGGTVYGAPQYTPIDEEHPTNPISSYGVTKLSIEKYLNLHSHLFGVRCINLRVSNPYGERQRSDIAQGVIATFLAKAMRGERVSIWGDGSVIRDYIHVTDVATAVSIALCYGGSRRTFNVGSGSGQSLNDIVDVVSTVTGSRLLVDYMPGRSFDVPVSVLDISRIRSEMSWEPSTPLIEGVERMAEWMRGTR